MSVFQRSKSECDLAKVSVSQVSLKSPAASAAPVSVAPPQPLPQPGQPDAPSRVNSFGILGQSHIRKGAFVTRFLAVVFLLMAILTGLVVSGRIRLTDTNDTLTQINVNLQQEPHEQDALIQSLADVLQEPVEDVTIVKSPLPNQLVLEMTKDAKTKLMSFASSGDPRLSKLDIKSIELQEGEAVNICSVGRSGPECSDCATSYGFSGDKCEEFDAVLSMADPFGLVPHTRVCTDNGAAIAMPKCVRTPTHSGLRLVHLDNAIECVQRMDNMKQTRTKFVLGLEQKVAYFEETPLEALRVPFVALYTHFNEATQQCEGDFTQHLWCAPEQPCQECEPSCVSGHCESAVIGDGTCVECAPNTFGLDCAPCNQQCLDAGFSCNDGFEGDGECLCPFNRKGPLCEQCQDGFFGPTCEPCQCTQHGQCADGLEGDGSCVCAETFGGALCDECGFGWAGIQCQVCAIGFYGPECAPCTCVHGACNQGLNGNGICDVCHAGFVGLNCDECAPGMYGPDCANQCQCGDNGQCNDGINGDGQCECVGNFAGAHCSECAAGFEGATCSECAEGFFGEMCEPCQCNEQLTLTCNQGRDGDGQCECIDNVEGANCGDCAAGFFGPQCQQECECQNDGICDDGTTGTGACVCQSNTAGERCERLLCSESCMSNGFCDNGVCVGCRDFFFGEDCENECTSTCQLFGTCNDGVRGNGLCSGCQQSRHGDQCQFEQDNSDDS